MKVFLTAGALVTLIAMVLPPVTAKAEEGAFRADTMRVSLHGGSGTAFNENYSIMGIGIGYFVADRLEAGIEIEQWQGGGPDIIEVSPRIMYIFPSGSDLRPYGGVFLTRTDIEGYKNLNTAGGRAGIFLPAGSRAYFGAGLVAERRISCDRVVYESCSNAYPEALIAVLF